MNENWIVRIVDNPGLFGKDLYIFRRGPNDKTVVRYSDREETIDRGVAFSPTMHLDPEILQALSDALQASNIRPKEAGKTEGMLEAQTAHLTDLRKLLKL